MPFQSLSSRFICQLRKRSFSSFGFSAIALVAIPLIAPAPTPANPDRICPAQLQQEVSQIAQSPELQAARVGVFIQTNQPKPQVLTNLDGDRYFIPASNAKLFTTAIALKTLGGDYRFATRLMSSSLPNAQGELTNGLWVIGAGDPSFRSTTGLKSLVTQLKNKGVKRINGGIWAQTYRSGDEIVGSWEWQDLQEYYAASVSPFTIDENSLNWTIRPSQVNQPVIFEWENPALASDWRVENQAVTVTTDAEYTLPENALKVVRPYGQKVLIISGQLPVNAPPEEGGVAIPDPKANFLRLLRQELIDQKIAIAPTNASPKLPPTQELAIAYSPPLSQLITTTNKDSNNLYAELLLRAVGEKFYTKLFQKPLGDRFYDYVPLNDVNGGLSSLKEYLDAIKVGSHNVLLADGSGLSRRNLTTPRAIAQLLYNVADDRIFRSSLPVSNVDGTGDGTLTNRWRDNPMSLQAKTGTLTGVSALSGYAKPQHYSEVIFSIMINNSNLRPRELNSYVDAIISRINRLEPCQ